MTKLNMRPWKGIVIGLECYECWHDAMAGMWKADNGGWHKMAWCIFFIVLFLVLVTQCRFYCMFLFQLVMRKWTTSTLNVFSYARVLDGYVVQLVHAWYRFSLQWLDF